MSRAHTETLLEICTTHKLLKKTQTGVAAKHAKFIIYIYIEIKYLTGGYDEDAILKKLKIKKNDLEFAMKLVVVFFFEQ